MRAVLTRVKSASVTIDGAVKGQIGKGFLVLLGVHTDDTEAEAERIADRICGLRVFEDDAGKMNVGPADAGAEILIVSQFTLYADAVHGNRPGFTDAAPPETARRLYDEFVAHVRAEYGIPVETGVFRAMMSVELTNDGPVTLWLDTDELNGKKKASR